MAAQACERLRSLVQDCMGKHLHASAVFYCDKLAALSGDEPADVYLLAQALFLSGQHKRALHLIQRHRLVEADPRFRRAGGACQRLRPPLAATASTAAPPRRRSGRASMRRRIASLHRSRLPTRGGGWRPPC